MTTSTAANDKDQVRYNFTPGRVLARKYEVISQVAAGRAGELYMLNECATGIERSAKFFYPHVNPGNRVVNFYAKKLHRLRHCDILMHYRTQETISVDGRDVTFLVSDSMHGELLDVFLARQPGHRLSTFEGLHLLHALAAGVDKLHASGEFHGQLAMDNIIIRRKGLGFVVKLIDLSPEAGAMLRVIRDDVCDLVHIFHEAIGGARFSQSAVVKAICCGMRRPQISEKFRDAGDLKRHLETLRWS